jgi:diadenylate cyclase
MDNLKEINKNILHYAGELAKKINADSLMINVDIPEIVELIVEFSKNLSYTLILATRKQEIFENLKNNNLTILQLPDNKLTRLGLMKISILFGLSTGVLDEKQRMVCVTGIAETGTLDTISYMEVSKEFEFFSIFDVKDIRKNFKSNVFQKILEIAIALGSEGREGKPVGATFVVGTPDELEPYTHQMILNPFKGYNEKERNILDGDITETIKEFSTLDGAFIIDRSGILISAGTYLNPSALPESLPRGLGTRHHAAAGITSSTSSLAITISESTGNVTVFHNGKIITEIESPRKIGKNSKERNDFYEKNS